jgi:hypothetical protein
LLLSSTTNSSQIRIYGGSKYDCQSPLLTPETETSVPSWPTAVRSRAPHGYSRACRMPRRRFCMSLEATSRAPVGFPYPLVSLLLSRLSPMSSATVSSPRPHMRATTLQPTKSRPQLYHHLTNLVDHSIGPAELRVSGIVDFPHSEFTRALPPPQSSVASTAQHSSIPSHPCFIFLVVYRSLGEDVISWFEL